MQIFVFINVFNCIYSTSYFLQLPPDYKSALNNGVITTFVLFINNLNTNIIGIIGPI